MVKTIELTQGQHALVDDIDFEFLNQFKWGAKYDKATNGFYARRNQHVQILNGKRKLKTIMMHRLIMERVIGRELKRREIIDHVNHDSLDNCRENLRIVSTRQNMQNQKVKKTSKYPGVSWHKRDKKWHAQIKIGGKVKHLGYFTDEREAAKAYEKACREFVGENLICKVHKVNEVI